MFIRLCTTSSMHMFLFRVLPRQGLATSSLAFMRVHNLFLLESIALKFHLNSIKTRSRHNMFKNVTSKIRTNLTVNVVPAHPILFINAAHSSNQTAVDKQAWLLLAYQSIHFICNLLQAMTQDSCIYIQVCLHMS